MANIKLIEKLSNAFGVSGYEQEVRRILKDEIKGYVDKIEVDSLGNLIAIKNMHANGPKVMLNAHMDEVGLIVDFIDEKGFLKFQKVGGIDDRVLAGKRVLIGNNSAKRVPGVIGIKAIHLQHSEKEEMQVVKANDLYIDIGAKSKEEAEKIVPLGTPAMFKTQFSNLNDGETYIGKAFDDRLGCAIITELLKNSYNFPIIALFSVQEEIGLRGSAVGTFKYTPDISITVEGTICADLPEVPEHLKCTEINKGPVITIKDSGTITDHELREKLIKVAKSHKIPYQFKKVVAGGTDAYRIQTSDSGVKVLTVAVPVRYIHSPVSLFKKADYDNTLKLLDRFLKTI
jgi:putative aminopeptidase FrvX